jgi:CRISPR system Cascade subunit CasB
MNAASTASPRQELREIVGKLAFQVASDGFPAGDRAALKRHAPGQPPPMAFYRLWLRHLGTDLPGEHQTQAWALIVWGLCLIGDKAHRADVPLGKALAEQGYSEARLERLLAADEEVQLDLMASAVRFLASKGTGFNWLDAALLLLARDPDTREGVNRSIAASYYRSLQKKKES